MKNDLYILPQNPMVFTKDQLEQDEHGFVGRYVETGEIEPVRQFVRAKKLPGDEVKIIQSENCTVIGLGRSDSSDLTNVLRSTYVTHDGRNTVLSFTTLKEPVSSGTSITSSMADPKGPSIVIVFRDLHQIAILQAVLARAMEMALYYGSSMPRLNPIILPKSLGRLHKKISDIFVHAEDSETTDSSSDSDK